ncbi:YaaR family protein [Heliobacterium chlorum]|uniref:YaaR family protein n=1 Tax=Heliobacterium chlorum TaxID=2698 RepID=A0ABR7T036_HELCL|nr:YaaR family protein [Heliobacterium chlorum]MBC9784157.1 YaaR family protein [Heliobacterium chlorum]
MSDNIKIKNFPTGISDARQIADSDRNAGSSITKEAFLSELHKARSARDQSDLQDLLERIDSAAQSLVQNRTVGHLKKYREMVKKFLAQVVGGAYQLKEEAGWDRRGRHKVLITVEKVNRQLDELASAVFSQQSESIDILGKTGEIRGLLLDIIT